MKHFPFRIVTIGLLFSAGISVSACKSKPKDTSTADTTAVTPVAAAPAPVVVAADDSLTTSIKDATKDYPGVHATANNGEVTLTGEIQRSKLQRLMESLHSLHPKKINNQLIIK